MKDPKKQQHILYVMAGLFRHINDYQNSNEDVLEDQYFDNLRREALKAFHFLKCQSTEEDKSTCLCQVASCPSVCF